MWQNLPTLLLLYGGWALFVLRLFAGGILLAHGLSKAGDLVATAAKFETMGFRPGRFWGPVAALVELAGGVGFVAGLFIQPLAVLVIFQFLIIIIWHLLRRDISSGSLELALMLEA
ncbi:MAG TPA: DoxX family protein, partial [Candidatus Paceibacterota bacterium]|nr:DoxX family protein [Candidatus Paceibacterota bacterium]